MIELIPPWPLFSVFLVAGLALAVTPGPAVFFIVARTIAQGRRAGLYSMAGVALGNWANAMAASIGLAAVFAVSSRAFSLVKWAGALYLVYLGVRMLFRPRADARLPTATEASPARVFRDAFLVALLNPKTTVFFAAFLPQFLTPETAPVAQSAVLGSIFVVMAAITDSVYALTASAIAPALARAAGVRQAGRYVGGGVLIGLGMLTAVSGDPSR